MRTYPKTVVRETVPARFVEIIKHVALLITSGDEATTIESDDLLQDDEHDYCGGLMDPEKRLFFFTFWPNLYDDDEADNNPEYIDTEWTYILSETQIADIAAGSLTEFDMWRCESDECTHRHAAADSYCNECDSR